MWTSRILIISLHVLMLSACKTPDLLLSPELKTNATSYEVKGRQGWMMNQVLSFGGYKTSVIKRGWTKSYDIPFILRFQGSSEKFSFTQYSSDSLSAQVFCLGKIKTTEYEIVKNIFAIPIKNENTFTGTIIYDTLRSWNFIIYNPDAGYGHGSYETIGFAKNTEGQSIVIKPVKRLENKKGIKSIDNYGFELFLDDVPVAAVSTLNKGKVWIRSALNAEQKLLVSTLSSAILIKSELGQNFKSDYTP